MRAPCKPIAPRALQAREEYLRSLGALFHVYWLMRLSLPEVTGSTHLDGQASPMIDCLTGRFIGLPVDRSIDDPATSHSENW